MQNPAGTRRYRLQYNAPIEAIRRVCNAAVALLYAVAHSSQNPISPFQKKFRGLARQTNALLEGNWIAPETQALLEPEGTGATVVPTVLHAFGHDYDTGNQSIGQNNTRGCNMHSYARYVDRSSAMSFATNVG